MQDCLFCQIAKNEIPSAYIYEDDIACAIMDVFPESKGHFLIIPKTHGETIFDIDADVLAHIIKLSQRLAAAAKKAFTADGIRIAQLNGGAAGQTVFHYHMHVIPCFADVAYKKHGQSPADSQEIQNHANAIKACL